MTLDWPLGPKESCLRFYDLSHPWGHGVPAWPYFGGERRAGAYRGTRRHPRDLWWACSGRHHPTMTERIESSVRR
jgi:hypothetical protein